MIPGAAGYADNRKGGPMRVMLAVCLMLVGGALGAGVKAEGRQCEP